MKPIIFEFIGGSWDGMNLHSDSLDPVEVVFAKTCYVETHGGTLGRTAVMPSEYATQQGNSRGNKYAVTHRVEIGGELLIRLELCHDDCTGDCSSHQKRVLLGFQNGYLHGLRLDSRSHEVNEALLATSCFLLTEHGKVGTTFHCCTDLPCHGGRGEKARLRPGDDYTVVQRDETDNEITVRLMCQTSPDERRPKV